MQPIVALEGPTERLAALALDAYALRHQAIAQNVANADSQNYQPLAVNFEEQLGPLRAAVAGNAPSPVIDSLAGAVRPFVEPQAAATPLTDASERLDDQMVQLVRNTLDYEAMLTTMARLGAITHAAISGG